MDKKKLIISLLSLFFLTTPIAYAQPTTGYGGGTEFMGGDSQPYTVPNPFYVVIATDESVTDLVAVEHQTVRGLHRFPWQFEIAAWLTWDSSDSSILDMIFEMEAQLNWYIGKNVNGKMASILIGWTTKDYDPYGGCAHIGFGSCLVKAQADWCDDNTVQHEVSHLYTVTEHCQSNDCVMSNKTAWYWWITEDWHPYEGSKLITVMNYQVISTVSENWCPNCYFLLKGSAGVPNGNIVEDVSSGGYVTVDPAINPPETPSAAKLNPPRYDYLALVGMGLAMLIVAIIYGVYRRGKRRDAKRLWRATCLADT